MTVAEAQAYVKKRRDHAVYPRATDVDYARAQKRWNAATACAALAATAFEINSKFWFSAVVFLLMTLHWLWLYRRFAHIQNLLQRHEQSSPQG